MAWLFENPNFRKTSKENVIILASMAIKQLIVMKENQIKKGNSGSVFWPSEQDKNSNNEQRKAMWIIHQQ